MSRKIRNSNFRDLYLQRKKNLTTFYNRIKIHTIKRQKIKRMTMMKAAVVVAVAVTVAVVTVTKKWGMTRKKARAKTKI